MKKIHLLILILITVFYSCIDEVRVPVKAEFTATVIENDYTVPVRVKLNNLTQGADNYNWIFEGATPSSSESKIPGVITYETPGTYTIKLEASNRDDSKDAYEVTLNINPPINVDFDAKVLGDNFSPVTVQIENKTTGATSFDWVFEGGTPQTSKKNNPDNIIFSKPGDHAIFLTVSNGQETYSIKKTINVAPNLEAKFDEKVAFNDDDYQAPVSLEFMNQSISATNYKWFLNDQPFDNGLTDKNPKITIKTPGNYKIKLIASNGKQEQVFTKEVKILEDTNLRSIDNVSLGINLAHKNNTVGAFYSFKTREVFAKNSVNDNIDQEIDLVFFGINERFSFNKFISPTDVQNFSFEKLNQTRKTIYINKQENCECKGVTVSEFDQMQNDNVLNALQIDEQTQELSSFDTSVLPRVILFKTSDNKKGAIKLKEFVSKGENSYIIVDIKVQKQERKLTE